MDILTYDFRFVDKPFNIRNLEIDIKGISILMGKLAEENNNIDIDIYNSNIKNIKELIEILDNKIVKYYRYYDVDTTISSLLKKYYISDFNENMNEFFKVESINITIPEEYRNLFDNKELLTSKEIATILYRKLYQLCIDTISLIL